MATLYRTDKPLLANPTKWSKNIKPSSVAGKYICWNDDNTTVSIQPDGRVETRPPNTDGAFEQCEIVGNTLVYDIGTWDNKPTVPVIYGLVVKP